MVGHSCLIYGSVKKSARMLMLIPALLVIPISYLTGIINIILHGPTTVDIIITTFIITTPHHLIMTTVIMTAVAIITWIVTYSYNQELLGNTETDK